MNPAQQTELLARIVDTVRAVYAGRPWLVATDIVQSAVTRAENLQAIGASKVFAIGSSMGTGDPPDRVPHAILGVRAAGLMPSIRAGEAALAQLPDSLVARLDAWDPERKARVVRTLFADGGPVGGRKCWGGRRPEWLALEDKTVIDALWDACGVTRQAAEVVEADPAALWDAHQRLDIGDGTVWAADNREGWHGGAAGTRWVRTEAEAHTVSSWMAEHAWKVRVMPFVEGVPCSIHGIVFPDYVVALRPCEMLVFRQLSTGRFKYGHSATFWDPLPNDRAQMREAVQRAGAYLRETVGYRGTFTIDGVMGMQGFVPTELNPRFGAAIGILSHSMPHLDLYLLHLAVVEGVPLDFTPAELEAVLLHATDTHRHGKAMQVLDQTVTESRQEAFALTPTGWQPAAERDAHVTVQLGPSPAGGLLRVLIDSAHMPVGNPIAPRIAALFNMIDARWNLGIGELVPARQVR